jgi:hypothetical protein
MVRSAMSGPTATIGAVRLVAPMRANSISTAAMPTCTPTTEQTETVRCLKDYRILKLQAFLN